MKLAVIADIHGNREAFAACLEHARERGAEHFALLGDYVGYGADPGWVIDRVRELVDAGARAVLGNHDLAVLEAPSPYMNPDARAVIAWTREELDEDQLALLGSLPDTESEGDCLFVHANAAAPRQWRYMHRAEDAARSLQATDASYVFCGHAHEPSAFRLSPDGGILHFKPGAGMSIHLTPGQRWLVVAGAAGQPRDGNPAASYVMFDRSAAMLTFHRVPYDHETAATKIMAAGLPYRLALRLIEGI
ncbi:metallophosphoesterase family protein [Caldimonas tepidiphila]|uniref:metallophosphoesterase family protein n=1 Tax=Caldimonas tepidiphila TaxID=2315841 RepID=UPI000E5A9E9D|nr:metallophosphoesterase family protein [Caldimonas tepidiphila]